MNILAVTLSEYVMNDFKLSKTDVNLLRKTGNPGVPVGGIVRAKIEEAKELIVTNGGERGSLTGGNLAIIWENVGLLERLLS